MAVDIQFLINGQDRGQPLNAKDFGVSITESVEINARIVTFDNELIFGNDMYTYLFDRLTDTGFCNLVEVEVHYECDGGWVKLTNGYIVLSECSFDLDKCQVKTKLYDDTFSTRINNNKSIPFSLSLTTSKNGNVVIPPRIYNGNFFSPATGLYDYESVGVCPVYLAFKHLVNCMSDGLVDFESSLFYWQEDTSYDSTLIITNGNALRNRSGQETIISFEELYIALKKKLNLGMAFERQANGRPLLRIELESYFYQSNPDVNLYDQPSIQLNFDKERLYQAVNFGSDPFLESEECDNGNTACQFVQTPFRGFRDEIFGFTGECNTSSILDLRTDEVIFDTNVIEDIFQFNVDRYTTNPIIVDAHYFFSSASYEMNQFDPYEIGQTLYNGDFRNILVSSNWINGYPNSLFSFLTTPFDPTTTPFKGLIDTTLPAQFFDATSLGERYYSIEKGIFIRFLDQVLDVGNNFDGSTYIVPETGYYTFTAQLIRRAVPDPAVGNVTQFVVLNHYTSTDVFISAIIGTPITQSYTSFSLVNVTGSFVCNEGDLIRMDWNVQTQNGSGVPMTIEATFGGQDTYFEGSGVPFNPLNPDEELDPVAIDEVRAYLYGFERPLTMAEIQLMLDNTSKPVSFGKYDDPLRVIEGFIKKVNIPSITRQKASIELKSNRLLR
jgi:hypothetical protein